MRKPNKITLTIAIPTYNRSIYLSKLLNDIEVTSLGNDCEILIIDNGSNDSTEEILKEFKTQSPCSIYRNTFNLGIEGNIIKALTQAKGEYVWLLSDHMNISSEGVKDLIKKLRNDRSITIGYAQIKEYGSAIGAGLARTFGSLTQLEKAKFIFYTSNISGLVVNTELVRKSIRSVYRMSGYTYPHLGVYFHLNENNRIIEFENCSSFQKTDKNNYPVSYDTFKSRFIDYPKLLIEISVYNSCIKVNGFETHIKAYTSALHVELLKRFLLTENLIDFRTIRSCLMLYKGLYRILFLTLWLTNFFPTKIKSKLAQLFIKAFHPSKNKLLSDFNV